MKTKYRFAQCELIKKTHAGKAIQVAWIPEKYAVEGKYIKLDGDNGWYVMCVYCFADYDYVIKNEREWCKRRKVTDI